jgi:hypothetical protein
MSDTQEQISFWPTEQHLNQGVDILEEFADFDALPQECLTSSSWLPVPVYEQLDSWAIGRSLPVSLIGFQQRPGLAMLGWLLHVSGMGGRALPELRLCSAEFEALYEGALELESARLIIEPGPLRNASDFYFRMTRTVLESGARVVIAPAELADGSYLRFETRPFGLLQRLGIQEDNLIVVDGS